MKGKSVSFKILIFILGLLVGVVFVAGAKSVNAQSQFPTFKEKVDHPICYDSQGKPIIRLFVATECEKCRKVEEVFIPVVQEYMAENLVTGRLWIKDKGDDYFTPEKENGFPTTEEEICFEFDPRCENSLMVVGCQFYRTGAPHETDYQAEEEELRGVIEEILARSTSAFSPIPFQPQEEKADFSLPFWLIGGLIGAFVLIIIVIMVKFFLR